ncbi:MAG: phosphoribosylamine--glycine ligase [Thermodesulfobacteriota bacterium]|nr:phosphoribosylamine--glycine ligase [Thermodesulfobacteriota bacterium]
MKILVLGSGGREHALVWKLRQSPKVDDIYCAPGNAGIGEMATCINIGADDIEHLLEFAEQKGIDLTVVGPEGPLTKGIVDRFEEHGLRIFGPSRKGAALEGSKVFTKELMAKYNIPTGGYKVFTDRDEAVKHIKDIGAPVVVKADGLAAGKGVVVARSEEEAIDAIDLIMVDRAFGEAGNTVLVEKFLTGEEASFIAFTDGKTVLPLPTSQDHKAVYDGDKGANTGGMGAYSPAPVVTDELHKQVMKQVMQSTVNAMASEGRPYKGMLYAGLMIDNGAAKVLEFNCRFGDPEAQPLLMRMQSDLVDVMEAVVDERLGEITLDIDPRPTVCVVMASGGYPGVYDRGKVIKGLKQADEKPHVKVFHAGTQLKGRELVTSGGRVLGVTAMGDTLDKAIRTAYGAVDLISWDDCYFRKDIGKKALNRKKGNALVGIVMGSESDMPVMRASIDYLESMGIAHEVNVLSAHRTPGKTVEYAMTARGRGLKVIIAGAGMAAHLAGALAAGTILPVIGVPIDSSPLNGLDALLSTVQMPPGVPVATMGIGKPGAKNAAILAAQIIGLENKEIARNLAESKGK